ncbi:MAG: tetratricopeptide repeat protein [Bacteroidota bacterium]
MKKAILTILLFICQFSFAQVEMFDQANEAYADGNYREATRLYKKVLDEGKTSAELYYNLANAYYKQNKVAESIYYYELALMLSPNDDSILNNLAFAENMTVDQIDPLPVAEIDKKIEAFVFHFNRDTWAKIAIGFSFLMLLFFLGYLFAKTANKKRLFFTFFILNLLSSVFVFWVAQKQEDMTQLQRYAIIFPEEIDVYSEPNANQDVAFLLHEGTKVKVLDNFRNFTKIELSNGSTGWTQETNLRVLKLK